MRSIKVRIKKIFLATAIFGVLSVTFIITSSTISNKDKKSSNVTTFSNAVRPVELISTFISNALSPLTLLNLGAITQNYIDDKYGVIKTKNGDQLEISLLGAKAIVYLGGLFWEDKAVWTTDVSVRHINNQKLWNRYDLSPSITSNLNVWTSGIGAPSFQVGAEIKYNGKFNLNLGTKIGINSGTKELEITKTVKNRDEANIVFAGVGWRYKITSFGQYATGQVDIDNTAFFLNTENKGILKVRREKPRSSFEEVLNRYINRKYI